MQNGIVFDNASSVVSSILIGVDLVPDRRSRHTEWVFLNIESF